MLLLAGGGAWYITLLVEKWHKALCFLWVISGYF